VLTVLPTPLADKTLLMVKFEPEKIPEAFWAELSKAANYTVTVKRCNPSPDGGRRSLVSEALRVRSAEVVQGGLSVELIVDPVGFAEGTVTVHDIEFKHEDDTEYRVHRKTCSWSVAELYGLPAVDGDARLDIDPANGNLNASFCFSFAGQAAGSNGSTCRDSWHVEGTIPLGVPADVGAVAGADRDSSGQVPDMLSGSWSRVCYDGKKLTIWGITARTTGSLEGVEVAARWAPFVRFSSDGRTFCAAEIAGGWRTGDAEWRDVGVPAPDAGNLLVRPAVVAEWAPQMGPINLDLGTGARFFVRGRCWGDLFKNVGGDTDFRGRPFFDGELFYNVSASRRIFLRGEYGYLPPDLSQEVSRVFVGMGEAF